MGETEKFTQQFYLKVPDHVTRVIHLIGEAGPTGKTCGALPPREETAPDAADGCQPPAAQPAGFEFLMNHDVMGAAHKGSYHDRTGDCEERLFRHTVQRRSGYQSLLFVSAGTCERFPGRRRSCPSGTRPGASSQISALARPCLAT